MSQETAQAAEGKRRKRLLPRWESNPTPPAFRAGILTTRHRGHLSVSVYRHVIVPPHRIYNIPESNVTFLLKIPQ